MGFACSTRSIEFPIFRDPSPYAPDAPKKTRGMSSAARDWLKRLQPFTSAEPDRDPLWVLHELNNADKHRELSVVGSAIHSQALTVTGNMQVRVRPAIPVSLGIPEPILPMRDGMELVRLAIVDRVAGGAVLAEGSFSFGISFEHPAIVRGEPAVSLMRSLTDSVGGIVDNDELPWSASGLPPLSRLSLSAKATAGEKVPLSARLRGRFSRVEGKPVCLTIRRCGCGPPFQLCRA